MTKSLCMSILFLSLFLPAAAFGQTISGPEVKLNGGEVYATFALDLEAKYVGEIRDGIEKELKFYIDLFRVWKVWPDEFVTGKLYVRTLRADPIKSEFVATSLNGNVLIERRFRSFESMLKWTLSFKDVKLGNTRELGPGQYFVKVTVESKVRKLPPVIGYFIIFLSENDFKVSKDSTVFTVDSRK